MADPLGLISNAASRGAGQIGQQGRGMGATGPDSGPGFRDVLMQNLNEVNKLQQDASKAIEDLQTGKREDLEGVILATQKADTAFRMLQSLRNKVVDAYDEVKQIRV
jgi:flagellar hook-basal body complex protein FliE